MTHAPNIPDKPLLSDLFMEHLASLKHADADKGATASAFSSRTTIMSMPIPIEVVRRQSATSAEADEGTLVSIGWWEGR